MRKLELIIEKNKDGKIWGRTKYEGNLIVEEGNSMEAVKKKMKKLLKDFHDLEINDIDFTIVYDLTVLFEQKSFLNISAIAKMANMNSSLLRQYASGIKFPSSDKAILIQTVIRDIGKELMNINLATKSREGNIS